MDTITETASSDALSVFRPAVATWFAEAFAAPTPAQRKAWPAIASGASTLLLAPTGSGKTLSAFLVAIDRIMFTPPESDGVRVLYISPLKALGVDVERNLRAPISGVSTVAERDGVEFHVPSVGIRSGDTPANERRRLARKPPEILITTPESLYLMLTSRARESLVDVETVIVDEIHTMVGTKRGAHLFVSLERLERLRKTASGAATTPALQRIGLSATQRPLDEVARLLGGAEVQAVDDSSQNAVKDDAASGDVRLQPRPVTIVDSGYGKQFDLRVEVPVEDMARPHHSRESAGIQTGIQTGAAAAGPSLPSIWPSIYPRLVELVKAHRSTMIFVNSRRLAERLAAAINETAEEELALAHHGSIAKQTRLAIEDRLKRGSLAAIVATSSLELGIDMGAVDLVIQIEAPPSVASGIQRIGRAGHQVDAVSAGVIFPKYRGDLLAASAAVADMRAGRVESSVYPRNPLDVLAQQLVAMVALGAVSADELYDTVRCAAPFAELPRNSFDGVLDLLAGRYPSDEFAELRPRVTWDRVKNVVSPRQGSQRVAILNAGTIPDRGLYGVFLPGDDGGPGRRVGELDEEMVYETRAGDVFLLGASSWRVLEITHDRVLVAPAPGEPGRMPFWRGDGPGRPLEFGQAIGALARELAAAPRDAAESELAARGLDQRAAKNLVDYLSEQVEATGEVPSDRTIVVESFLDEVGDWRVVVLSPFGARIHAPWAMAAARRLRELAAGDVDLTWTDDGMVFRLPESDAPPPLEMLLPASDEVEDLVVRELGGTALFASHFRENASRALLMPKRQPGRRMPLWLARRKAADLLSVAARYADFPILLETYRECLRDVFDLPALKQVLGDIERRQIRIHQTQTTRPSPFAASLMFAYTANFLYEGDAPLAERRAQTLALDYRQLRELLGDAEMRELVDADVVDALALELQRLDPRYQIRNSDALHELLLQLGDLTADEIAQRSQAEARDLVPSWLDALVNERRIIQVRLAGELRYAAAEDAARFRDALGVVPPPGLPEAFLESVADPVGDLVSRYARTHVPFAAADVAARLGMASFPVAEALARLAGQDRVIEGEFLPGGRGREWCHVEVLRVLKRRSLAKLRKQIEPVDAVALARFLPRWHGIDHPAAGSDAVLDAVEQLQGVPLSAVALERHILPARVRDYSPSLLDELCIAGEIVWRGFDSLGRSDGRVALYLADDLPLLTPLAEDLENDAQAAGILDLLNDRGALFFDEMASTLGGFRNDLLDALWRLVWAGHLTNDTLAPLRSLERAAADSGRHARPRRHSFRTRRGRRLPGSEGRWALLLPVGATPADVTKRQTALAGQLLERYGVVTRELVAAEGLPGGFAGLYPVLKAMEEAGQVRRGYFVAGMGGAQFAAPGVLERLRADGTMLGQSPAAAGHESVVLAATDPANVYGAAIAWPPRDESQRLMRTRGARVVLCNGELIGYLARGNRQLFTFLPTDVTAGGETRNLLAAALAGAASIADPILLEAIDGSSPDSVWQEALAGVGFTRIARGWLHRGILQRGLDGGRAVPDELLPHDEDFDGRER